MITSEQVVGPLTVAGIVALVCIAWRISIQMENVQGQLTSLKSEILDNRAVTCKLAAEQHIILGNCP